jgi:hypothetical protein
MGRRNPQAWTLAAILLAGVLPAQAQPAPAATPDFRKIRFDVPTVDGPVRIRAVRAHRWTDGTAIRLSLIGDVRLTLGERSFRARRASLWIRPLEEVEGTIQVFAYLEDVGDPGTPSGTDPAEGEKLSVRAILRSTSPDIRADLIEQGIPDAKRFPADAAVAAAGEEALAKSLRRQAGEAAEPPLPRFTPRSTGRREDDRKVRLPPRPAASNQRDQVPSTTGKAESSPRPAPAVPVAPSPVRPLPAKPGEQPATPDTVPLPPDESPRLSEYRSEPAAPAPPATPEPPKPPAPPVNPIMDARGFLTIAPHDVVFVSGEEESHLIATGGVVIQYAEPARDRVLHLTARRAVVFLDPGPLEDLGHVGVSRVRGVYLEGDVTATDGEYALRGPQVYYDIRANRAVMLDGVFSTYDQRRAIPLYMRARIIRQASADSYTAEGATFTNSPFLDPELSIGASRVTITRREREVRPDDSDPDQEPRIERYSWLEASHITGRVLGVPLFYWPWYAGDPAQRIVKDIRVENRSGSGGAVMSVLNIYPLLGLETPRKLSADLLADLYFERGPGAGIEASWADANQRGQISLYTVPFDRGVDVMKSGARINRDGDFRAILQASQRWRVDDRWTLLGELSHLSDPGVVDAFNEREGETRPDFISRLAARRLEGNSYLSVDLSGRLDDFIASESLLQSQGYSVTRAPEVLYIRHADDLLSPAYPGMLTWFSEYRAGRIALNFDEAFAREHGLTTNALAQKALGINASQRLGDAFRAAGLSEQTVTRADTRQELAAQFQVGSITVNPFLVGRATFYDRDVTLTDDNDQVRFWGATGVRASTAFHRIYENAHSRIFDIHQLRHAIEPSLTLWGAGTTIERDELPTYDLEVESMLEGIMARAGVRQVLQTRRGSPGRRHTVNLLTLDTDVVVSNRDAGSRGPIGRFLDFRPELSNPGDFFVVDAVVRLTDAASITGSTIYDLDAGDQAASSVGVLIRQPPTFSAALDLRRLEAQDSTYVTASLSERLTETYSVSSSAIFDTDEGQFQSIAILISRRFSSVVVSIGVSTNEITGETGMGFVVRPLGVEGGLGFTGTGDNWSTRLGQ